VKSSSSATKLLLIAIDGLSFPLLQKWFAMGDLPFLERLMEGGCYGLLKPFTPSNSAVIWTSIITGMNPRKHGIDSFIYYKVGERIVRKTAIKKMLKCGIRPLFRWLQKKKYIRDVPFSLSMVQQKMLWELFAQEDRSVGVINWWYSWPACEVPGFIISDRVHYWRLKEKGKNGSLPDAHLVYPDRLFDEVVKRIVDPSALPVDVYQQFMKVDRREIETMRNCHYRRHQLMSEFKYLYSMDASVKKLALYCLEEFPQPDFLAFYFRGIDIISHCALKYDSCNRDSHLTDKEIEQFGDTVHEYYCHIDRILKELIEKVSADTTVMIVSDHGFEKEPDGRFGHRKTKPPGLFVLNGQNVRTGFMVENASVYDITPTLLHLGDLPVSKEMDGVVLTGCVEETFVQNHPIQFIESYGSPLRHKGPVAHDSDEEIKERLRALGYID